MRVTFPRLPDHQRAYALVERDDGVVYRLYGGMAGPRLPHDIMHLIAERELRITDGIWAGIAAGVVFESMCHVSGRRPPHAAERSRELLRRFKDQGLRAELLADLVSSVAALDTMTQDKIRQLTRDKLAVLPPAVLARCAARWRGGSGRDRRGRAGAASGSGPLGPAAGRGGAEL